MSRQWVLALEQDRVTESHRKRNEEQQQNNQFASDFHRFTSNIDVKVAGPRLVINAL
jgi:hypothetical protein